MEEEEEEEGVMKYETEKHTFPLTQCFQNKIREKRRRRRAEMYDRSIFLPLNTAERDESSWAEPSCHVSLTASSQLCSHRYEL